MAQNGVVNRISYTQYKIFDLLLFLVILIVFEIINVFAIERWFPRQMFSLSVMLLVTLVASFRWSYLSVIFPIVDGVLYCWIEGLSWEFFIIYGVGNAFVVLTCLLFLIKPKKIWSGRWLLTLLYAAVGYILLVLGRSIVALFFGETMWNGIVTNLQNELFNLFFAVGGLLVLRRFNPMLEDQKEYCKKIVNDRENPTHPDEYRWEGYTELDQEALKKLQDMNEYDKAVYFNSRRQVGGGEEPRGEDGENDLSRLDG